MTHDLTSFIAGSSGGQALIGVVNPSDTPADGQLAVVGLDSARKLQIAGHDLQVLPLTIANGAAISSTVDCGVGYLPVRVDIPAAWTAADIIFLGSDTLLGTFTMIVDLNGNPLRISNIAASTIVTITGLDALVSRFIQLESVTKGTTTAANQGGARSLNLAVRSS